MGFSVSAKVSFIYYLRLLNDTCRIDQVCSVIGLSFQRVIFLLFGRLY